MKQFNFKIKKDTSENWLIDTNVTKKELTFGMIYEGNSGSLHRMNNIEIFDKSIISDLKNIVNSDMRNIKDIRYMISLTCKSHNYEQRHIINNLKIAEKNDHIILE